jgi:hypothetical protein
MSPPEKADFQAINPQNGPTEEEEIKWIVRDSGRGC